MGTEVTAAQTNGFQFRSFVSSEYIFGLSKSLVQQNNHLSLAIDQRAGKCPRYVLIHFFYLSFLSINQLLRETKSKAGCEIQLCMYIIYIYSCCMMKLLLRLHCPTQSRRLHRAKFTYALAKRFDCRSDKQFVKRSKCTTI